MPTRGAAAVEQFSIDGSQFLAFANYKGDIDLFNTESFIYKLNNSTAKFSLYQTINTYGGRDIEYFTIADKHYLAVANRQPSQQNSAIYQWNERKFVLFQNISTIGATSFNFLRSLPGLFLVVTNTDNTHSVVYKWEDRKFEKFQDIATEQSRASTVFVINNDTFIVFANHKSSRQGYSVQSPVFKWSGEKFVELQSLPTYGAWDVKSFNNNGDTFLAFANFRNGKNSFNIDSFIYKWNGTHFALFQSISTYGARAWHPFVMCGQTFLGVANSKDKSVVYQASEEQFIKYQEISTQGAFDMTSFDYKGQNYLAIDNFSNGKRNINSVLYKWI